LVAAIRQRSPARGLSEARTRLESLVDALRQQRDRQIAEARWEVQCLRSSARAATGRYVREQGERVRLHSAVLDALEPRRVLGRGYALLMSGDEGRPVRSVADVAVQEALSARLVDGVILARVQGRAHQPLPAPGAIDVGR
jgi:exodeoxyribonuclease VII large subunit